MSLNYSIAGPDGAVLEQLKKMNARNIREPLPFSSHVKAKGNGIVYPWAECFATDPDAFDNCDSFGNTERSAWEGTAPLPQNIPNGWEDMHKVLVPESMALGFFPNENLNDKQLEEKIVESFNNEESRVAINVMRMPVEENSYGMGEKPSQSITESVNGYTANHQIDIAMDEIFKNLIKAEEIK